MDHPVVYEKNHGFLLFPTVSCTCSIIFIDFPLRPFRWNPLISAGLAARGSSLVRGSWYHMNGLLMCACDACSHFIEANGVLVNGTMQYSLGEENLCGLAPAIGGCHCDEGVWTGLLEKSSVLYLDFW